MATTTINPSPPSSPPSPSHFFHTHHRCCFCIPHRWQKVHTPSSPSSLISSSSQTLWSRSVTAFMKLREWSELAAGPRWKTFIRRFNRNRSSSGRQQSPKFQYDPLEYSLNFDDGFDDPDSETDKDFMVRNFSSRYASRPVTVFPTGGIPTGGVPTMVLGKEDVGPNVF